MAIDRSPVSARLGCAARWRLITRDALERALGRRPFADWVVFRRDAELHVRDADSARSETRTRWRIVVHVDTPAGRGTARLGIDGETGDADAIAETALAMANATVGTGWPTIPAAAPARVELADPALGDLAAAGARVLHSVAAPHLATVSLAREHVEVASRQGLQTEWYATHARVDAIAIAGAHSLPVVRQARRLDALELAAALAGAVADLALVATAGAPVPGPCAIIVGADALVPQELGDGTGVWAAFAAQADAVVAREGLARLHEGEPIAPGADRVAEPLSIKSDGALPFGVASAPLGEDGDAVRRFALVERGALAGLALSPREAALRAREPNGGVRNLVVATGSWDGASALAKRVVEIRRLRDLAIDRYTGTARLEIALGIERGGDHPAPFAGGAVHLDLIAALATARRSSVRIRRGPYDGPASVLIEAAELLA